MIQVGDKILVRHALGAMKARVVTVDDQTIFWRMTTNRGRSSLEGYVSRVQIGDTWTEGWSRESFHLLRFLNATERW